MFWLLFFLSIPALGLGLPLLAIALEVIGAWYDNLFDRLETAAERFCVRRGWF